MKTYTVVKKIEITQGQIDDIMADALHTAISYWCGEVDYKKRPDEDVSYMSDALTRGATIGLWDFEEEKWHELTLEKLLHGFEIMPHFDLEDYDNDDVDSLVQYALFGEVIYA